LNHVMVKVVVLAQNHSFKTLLTRKKLLMIVCSCELPILEVK